MAHKLLSLPNKITDYHYSLEYVSKLIGRVLINYKGYVNTSKTGGWTIEDIIVISRDKEDRIGLIKLKIKDWTETVGLSSAEWIPLIHGDYANTALGYPIILRAKDQ